MKSFHCIIHRQVIAAKLEPEVHKVLQAVADIVTIPCNEMGSDRESHIPTLRLAGYLVAKCLKELANLKMH